MSNSGPFSDDGGTYLQETIGYHDMNGKDGLIFTPSRIESAVEALDLHLDYWRWVGENEHLRVMARFLQAYTASGHPLEQNADVYARDEANNVDLARTHWISPDVADLTRQMGEAMPPDMLYSTDLPTPCGIAIFGRCWPYMNHDEGGYLGAIPVRAVMWREQMVGQPDPENLHRLVGEKPGVMMYLYADREWLEEVYGSVRNGPPLGGPMFLVDMLSWTFDTWWQDADEGAQPDQAHQSPHVGVFRRMILSLWRFMNEELVRTERVRPPRPARRRWERAKIRNIPDDGTIVEVLLRRYKKHHRVVEVDADGHEMGRAWTHRFWKVGHWRRNHWTGEKDIWVRPHLFPDDPSLPIVVKQKLTAVAR